MSRLERAVCSVCKYAIIAVLVGGFTIACLVQL